MTIQATSIKLDKNYIYNSSKPDISKLPGGWEPHTYPILIGKTVPDTQLCDLFNNILVLNNVLTEQDCLDIIKFVNSSGISSGVSVQGRQDAPDDRIGSTRTTMWCPGLSDQIWSRMVPHVYQKFYTNDKTLTDWHQASKTDNTRLYEQANWKAICLSPMLRFMRYNAGGMHYAHYDAGYIYDKPEYRTLMSVVIYLSTCQPGDGGCTRFINDKQDDLPVYERDNNDWIRPVEESEVIKKIRPITGSVLIFPHRMCHDVEQYIGNDTRYIIRTDLVYKRING